MSILGFVLIKNEEDIIETTIRHFLAEELDHIYAIDNLSSDNTPIILNKLAIEFPDKITIIKDNEFAFYQSKKMNKYISIYAKENDWIIPFDSDEIWIASKSQTLKSYLNNTIYEVIECPVWDMIPTLYLSVKNPILDIKKKKITRQIFPVVAFKYNKKAWLADGNHQVKHFGLRNYGDIEVCHFQYRSFEQFCNKLNNGKKVLDATDLDESTGFHWREGGSLSEEVLWQRWVDLCVYTEIVIDPCFTRIEKWN
jgi:glycosyltransferase involved in cell wall biosynthesis